MGGGHCGGVRRMKHPTIPTQIDCEILEWMSRRSRVRWANIPQHWRKRVHQLTDAEGDAAVPRWIEREAFVMVKATDVGRMIAAGYRAGRAAAPKEQSDVG